MTKNFWIGFFLIIIVGSTKGQIMFQERLGGSVPSWINSVIKSDDSGYVFSGGFNNSGYMDISLFETDIEGNLLWSKIYQTGVSFTEQYSLEKCTDGGYIISAEPLPDLLLNGYHLYIRTNSTGDTLWTRYYENWFGIGRYLKPAKDGGFLSSWVHIDTTTFVDQPCLSKLDSIGNFIWTKSYIGNFSTTGRIYELPDSGCLMLGLSDYFGFDGAGILKTNSNGIAQWCKSYGASGFNYYIVDFTLTADGGCCIAGGIRDSSLNDDILLFRLDSLGNVLWSKMYSASRLDFVERIIKTADDGFVLAGTSTSFSVDSSLEGYLIRTDSLGNLLWANSYYGWPYENFILDLVQTPDMGFMLAGRHQSNATDGIIIKTDSLGNSGCYSGTVYPLEQSITTFAVNTTITDTQLFMSPHNFPLTVSTQGSIVTLCNTLNDDKIDGNASSEFFFSPNPIHTDAKLVGGKLELDNMIAKIKIYNSIGILIREENISKLSSYILHRDGLREGLYYFQLSTSGPAETSVTRAGSQLTGSGKFIVE